MPRVDVDYSTDWSLFGDHGTGDAFDLLRFLEKHLSKGGWHVALTGGVLRKGRSTKDLDIIVYPHVRRWWNKRPNMEYLHDVLKACGLFRRLTKKELWSHWRTNGSKDTKWVEVWGYQGRRVDLMVLS